MHKPIARAGAVVGLALLLSGIGLGGCGGDPAPDPDELYTEEELNTMYTRTVIRLNDDGTHSVVSQIEVSLAEQIAERDGLPPPKAVMERRHTLGVGYGDCSNDELKIYDQTGYAGHELCLTGLTPTGTTFHFGALCWPGPCVIGCGSCTDHWANRVRSFRVGNSSVRFSPLDVWYSCQGGYCGERTSDTSSASTCERDADYLRRPSVLDPC
jgi:hypothetical protein